MDDLTTKYTGQVAAEYEARRSTSWKWKFEDDAVDLMLDLTKPETLLDIACGTGRFADKYQKRGIYAVGLDVSADMLAQASARGMVVRNADFFCMQDAEQFDVVLSIRFLNWLPPELMAEALRRIGRTARSHAIVSCATAKESHRLASGVYLPRCDEFHTMVEAAGMYVDSCCSVSDAKRVANVFLLANAL